jgi:hypothetical protein
MNDNRVLAGLKAKKDGHNEEERICAWLNEQYAGTYVLDAKNKTKVDILNITNQKSYSLKSVSKNHTQCHLTSTSRWCEYFNIQQPLRSWFDMFFGVPNQDITNGKSRRHRFTSSQIDENLNQLALNWFDTNKVPIFDVIVYKGMYDTPVEYLIWNLKKTQQIEIHEIDFLRQLVYNGNWILKPTTLHFLTEQNKKLFHLQMKGSGEKYTSGYHGLMFHIHKCF